MYWRSDGGWRLVFGIFRLTGRALVRPFTCDPGDRLLVVLIWLAMLALGGGAAFYAFGPLQHTDTLDYAALAAAVVALALWFWLGAWGQDIQEIDDAFDDPLDSYDEGGPWSGHRGQPF